MKYWMFCVIPQKDDGRVVDSEEILRVRFGDAFWGLGEKTPNRQALQAGDQVVFYLGNPRKAFGATAVLESDSFGLSASQQQELSHGSLLYAAQFGVWLSQTKIWDQPRRVEDLLTALTFIENKEYWYVYFQGGVRELPESDFEAICRQGSSVFSLGQKTALQASTAATAEFALEAHLEEFIDKNWRQIDFGRKLSLYNAGDQRGRQFPAGPWSIDFLCKDDVSGALVVIELKRGQTSDATVGQVLRYINWTRENVATRGEKVEGIIIARDIDDALHYALKDQPQISVLTYSVDFKLQNAKA